MISFVFLYIYNSFYFWLCWVVVAAWALLRLRPAHLLCSCGALAPHCSDFSWCGAQALEHGLNSCGAQA